MGSGIELPKLFDGVTQHEKSVMLGVLDRMISVFQFRHEEQYEHVTKQMNAMSLNGKEISEGAFKQMIGQLNTYSSRISSYKLLHSCLSQYIPDKPEDGGIYELD